MDEKENKHDCKKTWQETLKGNEGCFDFNAAASEKGKSIRFNNESKKIILRIKVDDCLIEDKIMEKCDYAFVICETEELHFVEFKGSGVSINKPYQQLVETISYFQKHKKTQKDKVFAYIIGSNVPKGSNKMNDLKEDFRKKYGKQLNRTHEYQEIII